MTMTPFQQSVTCKKFDITFFSSKYSVKATILIDKW